MWIHDFEHLIDGERFYHTIDSMIIDTCLLYQGQTWCILREQLDDLSISNYYRETDEGIWFLQIEHEDTTAGLLFKYPATPGEKWLAPRGDTLMVVSINETVTVPVGTFEGCYYYRYLGDNQDEGMWLKPGVGWIQSMWREENNEFWFRLQQYFIGSES